MSKVFIEETTLSAIGDAIREKTGKTDLIAPLSMATEISSITTGGDGEEIPDEAFVIGGYCNYKFAYDNMSWLLNNETYKNKWNTDNLINNASHMFYKSNMENVPFNLRITKGSSISPINIDNVFCESELKRLPELETEVYANGVSGVFAYCYNIRELPQSWYDNLKLDYIQSQNYPSCSSVFQNCYSLRKVDSNFIKNCRGKETTTSVSGSICYNSFSSCYVLDEIVGLPAIGQYTFNIFSSTFSNCHRLKNIIFDTNDDGTAKTVNWSGQILDFSGTDFGYVVNWESRILKYNSGITTDKAVSDDASYQALKNDPDWYARSSAYCRYNHDSAVNTINSLPDTSAYLASTGGTNTIKFRGVAGSATDGGAINTMTEEEIAVATAKGWTVSFVE